MQAFLLCSPLSQFCPDQSRHTLPRDSNEQQCLPYQQVNSSTQLSNPWSRALASEPVSKKLRREIQRDLASVTSRRLKSLEKTQFPKVPSQGGGPGQNPALPEREPWPQFLFFYCPSPQHRREGSRLILVLASAADLKFWWGFLGVGRGGTGLIRRSGVGMVGRLRWDPAQYLCLHLAGA